MPNNLRKIIINNLAALYFINNILLIPSYIFTFSKTDLFDERIINKISSNKVMMNFDDNDEIKTYKYLKLSTILVDNYLKYDLSINDYKDQTTVALEKRIGDCEQFAEFTYTNFLYFTKHTDNKNLRKYVRLAAGIVTDSFGSEKHKWLEVKFRDKWYPFEPTALKGKGINYINTINENKTSHIDSLLVINNLSNRYTINCRLSIDENDNKQSYPEILHALVEPKGIIYDMMGDLADLITH